MPRVKSAVEDPCPEAAKAMASVCDWSGGQGISAYRFNPRVTFVSITLIWTLIIIALVMPEYLLKAMDEAAFMWISEVWVWFYLGSKNIWLLVLVYLAAVPKYGNLRMCRPGEKPEYSDATWFAMLFSAGMAVGMFYFGVAEPLWHYKGYDFVSKQKGTGARWHSNVKGYGNSNQDAIHAIMLTWYHWGVHAWSGFTTMGLILGILVHRRGFPMSIRYAFYPLMKHRTCGLFGDFIDVASIVSTITGVSCSLGVGTFALNSGFIRMSQGFWRGTRFSIPANETLYSDPSCGAQGKRCEQDQIPYGVQDNVETQCIIVACVTCLATASVVSGLNTGIVNLSRLTFALGMVILLTVFFMGEPYHTLNVLTQAFGYLLYYFPKISFQTDAYELLGHAKLGLGGADDHSGSQDWMRYWTLFMWGWVTSWGPFVGAFIAKVSKGRRIRTFVIATMIAPSAYSFVWLGTFGAEGIRLQRIADSTGLCDIAAQKDTSLCQQEGTLRSERCYLYAASYTREMKEQHHLGFNPDCQLDPVYHGGFGRCKEFLWKRRTEVGDECVVTTSWVHMPCNKEPQAFGGPGRCNFGGCQDGQASMKDPTALSYPPVRGPCKGIIMMSEVDPGSSKRTFNWFYGAQPRCFVPVQDNVVCLYGQDKAAEMFFDVIASYGPKGYSELLSTICVVAMILYFVTSSDSGSFTVDMFASNGDQDPPTSQRIFWSVTEGTCCAVLMYSGKNLADSAAGFKALQGAVVLTGLPYTVVIWFVSQALVLLCKEEAGDYSQERKSFKIFIIDLGYPIKILGNTLGPGITMGRIIGHVGGWPLSSVSAKCSETVFTFVFQGVYSLAVGLVCISGITEQWHIVGLVLYIGFTTFLGFLRNQVRRHLEIDRGDLFVDVLCGWFLPMFTLVQMDHELFSPKVMVEDDTEKETAAMLTMYGLPRD
eukprot:gnl/MRDRNA2_/MRDRNA2_82786_c0_seq2.p1 gnl/MRDRNA2_/MRDRNA2_82786_c0~~gnl/MRDRNA2_/MRDRNA2_82786_c0_seq2.p1  ORF type:complete len:934 (+),score=101.54 gnl/MRDRNA2_/MRDRNA2_82786_c0_seq2:257-3058(+)